MGTYLSTPVLDKCEEEGTDAHRPQTRRAVNWGVVDMQGWRKSMEDAHVARTDVVLPAAVASSDDDDGQKELSSPSSGGGEGEEPGKGIPNSSAAAAGGEGGEGGGGAEPAKVFAVFDGHGGPEVARFCQLYLVDVLTAQKEWRDAEAAAAVGAEAAEAEAATAGAWTAATEEADGTGTAPHVGTVAPYIGRALIESFHALDRMIDDPSRRDELTLLRSEKPRPGSYRSIGQFGDDIASMIPAKVEEHVVPPPVVVAADDDADACPESGGKEEAGGAAAADAKDQEEAAAASEDEAEGKSLAPALVEDTDADSTASVGGGESIADDGLSVSERNDAEVKEVDRVMKSNVSDDDGTDSMASVGGGDSIADDGLSDDLDDDDNDDNVERQESEDNAEGEGGGEGVISTSDAMALFQRILTMSGASGTVEVEVENGEEGGDDVADGEDSTDSSSDSAAKSAAAVVSDDGSGTPTGPAPATVFGPNAAQPTRIQNGRQVCNLPDHPIHAGCTSVVAVLVGNTVTVANAGDSRAVLCREGGVTEALSFDHKPLQDRENNRIAAAGGFVNQFGRVNGNLNLSRSIGDMKYKQVPGIPPSGQMITAEPDIVQVTLNPADEFLILGCDGIWDCLTNEEAVKYVRDRIDEMTPVEIGREMLDEIISDDPRASQGIGGDNMTIMIIDLQPKSRSYFN